MIPVILDSDEMTIAVIGSGPQAQRRLQLVDAAGARYVRVFAENPDADMVALAGERLIARWPSEDEIAQCHLIYIANVDDILAEKFTHQGRRVKTLVNVEDVRPLCDFHVPAIVRRGDLVLTVSTGGKSPGLARRLKRELERLFPEVWGERLQALASARDGWRAEGTSFKELLQRTDDFIDREKWLPK
jgi:precorrin-2 dehydrogenase/sirohydrochlorin ferrochelatase